MRPGFDALYCGKPRGICLPTETRPQYLVVASREFHNSWKNPSFFCTPRRFFPSPDRTGNGTTIPHLIPQKAKPIESQKPIRPDPTKRGYFYCCRQSILQELRAPGQGRPELAPPSLSFLLLQVVLPAASAGTRLKLRQPDGAIRRHYVHQKLIQTIDCECNGQVPVPTW